MFNLLLYFFKPGTPSNKQIVNYDSLISQSNKNLDTLQNKVNKITESLYLILNEIQKLEDSLNFFGLHYSYIFLIGFIILLILIILSFYFNQKKLAELISYHKNVIDNSRALDRSIEDVKKQLSAFDSKYETITLELQSVKTEVENLQKIITELADRFNNNESRKNAEKSSISIPGYEFVSNININNNRISKTKSRSFYILLRNGQKYYLSISEDILNSKPTMENNSKIKDYFELRDKPSPMRYKLINPTALSQYNEETGDFNIETKGLIEHV